MKKHSEFISTVVQFDQPLLAALRTVSREAGKSVAWTVRRACVQWLQSADASTVREAGRKAAQEEESTRSFLISVGPLTPEEQKEADKVIQAAEAQRKKWAASKA